MTSHAEAFLAGLAALCRQHQIALYVGGESDEASALPWGSRARGKTF